MSRPLTNGHAYPIRVHYYEAVVFILAFCVRVFDRLQRLDGVPRFFLIDDFWLELTHTAFSENALLGSISRFGLQIAPILPNPGQLESSMGTKMGRYITHATIFFNGSNKM